MKKIFITGSAGQLGQALIKLFKSRYEIISTSRSTYNKNDYFLDITDPILTKDLIATISPDIIINLAALTSVDLCERKPELANSINFHGVQNLVNAFNGPIIHLSTDYVFDGSKGQYSEEDVTNPINEYGRTKLEGEQYLAKNSKDSLIIRTNVLYDYVSNSTASFLNWVVHSLNDKTVINVVDDQINNPTWTMSLAIVIDRAIQVHGAKGLTDDTPLSLMYRHAREARIYDGPDEVHVQSVARRILKNYQNNGLGWDFGERDASLES